MRKNSLEYIYMTLKKFVHEEREQDTIVFIFLKKLLLTLGKIKRKIFLKFYTIQLKLETTAYNIAKKFKKEKISNKYLYASAVGQSGKEFLAKVIEKFGHAEFGYIIFVYDNTQFNEDIFQKCEFIYEKGVTYEYYLKYITPKYCEKYDYIFLWDDDVDPESFSYKNFIEIMKRNNLEIAQPALTKKSYFSWKITLKDDEYKVGRYTDCVELMVPVYSKEAWSRVYPLLKKDKDLRHATGYDFIWKSVCGFKNLGIVDCEAVTHTRPVSYGRGKEACDAISRRLALYSRYKKAKLLSYGKLK